MYTPRSSATPRIITILVGIVLVVCCYSSKAQAVSYTTGVPTMIGAKMMLTGKWRGKGVFNMEQFDPDPFMADLVEYGLPYTEQFYS